MQSFTLTHASPLELIAAHVSAWRESNPQAPLNLYALVEPEQHAATWRRLQACAAQLLPLLELSDSSAQAASPHLAALGLASAPANTVHAALVASHPTQAFTLICSPLDGHALQAHLAQFVEVMLPGNHDLLLAYWDPAILGALVGQTSDDSLHMAGPVLAPEQRAALLQPISAWWYCDRLGRWQHIEPSPAHTGADPAMPLNLSQAQEDMLVEASVPDQILYHLELNQPNLFDDSKTHAMRHGFVRGVLNPARALGLSGMRDLVNFTALCMTYRQRMQSDPQILGLLDQVQKKAMTLDEAMPLMPE